MKKKNYSAPQQKVVILSSRTSLLAGSGEEQLNSYENGGVLWDDGEKAE